MQVMERARQDGPDGDADPDEDEVLQREGFETRLMDEGRSEEGEKVEHVEDSHEPI
jgi:hypothetical protein